MTFPARAVEIVHALYHANPQDDAARRVDIQKVGEQLAFELGPRWGNKKRTGLSDAFRSPDSIAYREDGGAVSVWDVQASSGQILVHAGKPPDHPQLSPDDATFMDCAPVDHLGVAPPDVPDSGIPNVPNPGTNVPDPGVPPSWAVDLLVSVAEVKATMDLILAVLNAPARPFPVYRGGLGLPTWLGGTRPIELKPEDQ